MGTPATLRALIKRHRQWVRWIWCRGRKVSYNDERFGPVTDFEVKRIQRRKRP